ncbi:MAG: XcyI family restriction endonuclease [Bacillota bacterium]
MDPVPHQQITFAKWLRKLQGTMLQGALGRAVCEADIHQIDRELHLFVPPQYLSRLAGFGLRGELLFPVPSIVKQNPALAGYYRLVVGLSKKECERYPELKRFSALEPVVDGDEGDGRPEAAVTDEDVDNLCRTLTSAACSLLDELEDLTAAFLHELTLLTLGAQFRGSYNNIVGRQASGVIFQSMREILVPRSREVIRDEPGLLVIRNASGREVSVRLGADPDILVSEEVTEGTRTQVLSVEVKGGKDRSNIHNRLGEAEKTHLKCKESGALECWTVVGVEELSLPEAKRESPTTNRFFLLRDITSRTPASEEFARHLVARVGVPFVLERSAGDEG